MRIPSPTSDLTDAQLEALVLAWMAQELSIAPESAPLVLRFLGGSLDPEVPLSRDRTLELTQAPDDLCRSWLQLDEAVTRWLDSYLIDFMLYPNGAIPVSPHSVALATGIPETHVSFLSAYLQSRGALLARSSHHWPGYETWHLAPEFADRLRAELRTGTWEYSAEGDAFRAALSSRLARITSLAEKIDRFFSTQDVPAHCDVLELLTAATGATAKEVLEAERLLLAEREDALPPSISVRVAA